MVILTGKTVVAALRPPYPYGAEFVGQFMFALKLCWFTLLISTVAFGYEAPGAAGGGLPGAVRRAGSSRRFLRAGVDREFAPFVTAVVLAGVAGTAITADLGARKIREELDALQVLGVDPIKTWSFPGSLALMLVTGLFDIYALRSGSSEGCSRRLSTTRRWAHSGPPLQQHVDHRPMGVGAEDDDVRGDHRDRLLLQRDDCVRRRRGGGARRQ